jgi:hypothetical protein
LFKFFPSICVLVVFHFMSLYFKCKIDTETKMNNNNNNTVNNQSKNYCHLFIFDIFKLKQINNLTSYDYWENNESVLFSQLFNHIFLSIYFGLDFIDYSFVILFF